MPEYLMHVFLYIIVPVSWLWMLAYLVTKAMS